MLAESDLRRQSLLVLGTADLRRSGYMRGQSELSELDLLHQR
jgi:hypothetical protein